MSLPNSYNNTFKFNDSVDYSMEEALWEIFSHLKKSDSVKDLSADDQVIKFTYQSLFTIKYEVEFSFSKSAEIEIDYEIKLGKLLQICIALAIFIAFFSSFGITGYLWFSAIFLLIFYTVNLVFTDNLVVKLIKSSSFFILLNKSREEGVISPEQKKWIKDASKCPACGEDINEYDLKCPECGIRLRSYAGISPIDVSTYRHKRFRYYFKEKKEIKNDT